MPNEAFFNNDDEAPELIQFWEELGHPVVPPELEDVPIEDMADQAIGALQHNLTVIDAILQRTIALYSTIKIAGKRSKPVTPSDHVTAAVCLAAADEDTHRLLRELAPAVRSLCQRAHADDLTVLKLVKLTVELDELQPKIEQVMRWHENLKHALSTGMAQLN